MLDAEGNDRGSNAVLHLYGGGPGGSMRVRHGSCWNPRAKWHIENDPT
jgi:hypothetical protein